MTNTYLTIESQDINDTITKALYRQGLGFTCKYFKGAGTKEMFQYTIDLGDYALAGDTVMPRIIHMNSYKGESAMFTTGGFLRAACNNGMVMGQGFFGQRIIHRKGQTAERKLKQLEYQIAATASYLKNDLPEIIQELADSYVSQAEMIEIAANLPLANCHKEWIIQKIVYPEFRRAADQDNNLWILWNLANEAMARNYSSPVRFFERNLNLVDDIQFLYDDIVSRRFKLEIA